MKATITIPEAEIDRLKTIIVLLKGNENPDVIGAYNHAKTMFKNIEDQAHSEEIITREELMDRLQEIQDRNYNNFKGTNEAELHTREEIADLFFRLQKFDRNIGSNQEMGYKKIEPGAVVNCIIKLLEQQENVIKCDVCGNVPSTVITTMFGTYCFKHAKYA